MTNAMCCCCSSNDFLNIFNCSNLLLNIIRYVRLLHNLPFRPRIFNVHERSWRVHMHCFAIRRLMRFFLLFFFWFAISLLFTIIRCLCLLHNRPFWPRIFNVR